MPADTHIGREEEGEGKKEREKEASAFKSVNFRWLT
jgi:hypothetical protein